MKALTVRRRISSGESLYSFLMRCAEDNGMNFLDLFNLLRRNKYKLYTWDIHRLDFYPSNVIDTDRLYKLTNIVFAFHPDPLWILPVLRRRFRRNQKVT